MANKTSRALLPAIQHLAAPGARVATDGLRSYAAVGKSVRPDVRHRVVNHSAKEGSKFKQRGVHTNNVEGMNAVLKRTTRRRFWQVQPKNSTGDHWQLAVFIENCRLGKKKVEPIAKLLCAFVHMRKVDPSSWAF